MRGYIRTIVFAAYIIATCSQTFSQINATFNEENFTVLSPINIHIFLLCRPCRDMGRKPVILISYRFFNWQL